MAAQLSVTVRIAIELLGLGMWFMLIRNIDGIHQKPFIIALAVFQSSGLVNGTVRSQ
jgi:hypothetical protein